MSTVLFIIRLLSVLVCESWWANADSVTTCNKSLSLLRFPFFFHRRLRVDIYWLWEWWALIGGAAIGDDGLLMSLTRIFMPFKSRGSMHALSFHGFCTALSGSGTRRGACCTVFLWLDLLQCDILLVGNQVLWTHIHIPSKVHPEWAVHNACHLMSGTHASAPRDIHFLPSVIGHGAFSRMPNFILHLGPLFRLTENVYEPSGLTKLQSKSLILPPDGSRWTSPSCKIFTKSMYKTLRCRSLHLSSWVVTVGLYSVWKVKGTIKEDLVTLLLTTPTSPTIKIESSDSSLFSANLWCPPLVW